MARMLLWLMHRWLEGSWGKAAAPLEGCFCSKPSTHTMSTGTAELQQLTTPYSAPRMPGKLRHNPQSSISSQPCATNPPASHLHAPQTRAPACKGSSRDAGASFLATAPVDAGTMDNAPTDRPSAAPWARGHNNTGRQGPAPAGTPGREQKRPVQPNVSIPHVLPAPFQNSTKARDSCSL